MRVRTLLLTILAALALPTTATDRIRIVNEGGIKDEWTLPAGATLAAPGYPAEFAQHPEDVCVAIGYLVNEDGHTSDFALLSSWSSGDHSSFRTDYWSAFANAASYALAQWKFIPRPEVKSPRPVYTVGTFVFGATASQETREQCVIVDVPRRLAALRHTTSASRLMKQGIFNDLAIDPKLERRVGLESSPGLRDPDYSTMGYVANPTPPPPPPPAAP